MDDADEIRRKAIWDRMTESERNKAEREKSDIIKQSIEEEKKAIERIKLDGRYKYGLDGHYPELVEISVRRNRRLNELLKRLFEDDTTYH